MTFQVFAPGKLLLLGEYAVLEGSPALVAAVNRYCRVSVTTHSEPSLKFIATNLQNSSLIVHQGEKDSGYNIDTNGSKKVFDYSYCLEALNTFQKEYSKIQIPSASISVDTSAFYEPVNHSKIGLGSSAAVTVATIAGLQSLAGANLERNQIFSLALGSHRRAQNNKGSGVDIAASVYGGLLKYVQPANPSITVSPVENITIPNDLYIIPVWTGYSVSTRQFIQRIKQLKASDSEKYQIIMKSLHQLASLGIENLESGRISYFLEITQEYGNVMNQLGQAAQVDIFSDIHRAIGAVVEQSGGIYKPSGAGGGDIGIALVDSLHSRQRVIESLEKKSFTVLDLTIDSKGVIIRD